MLDFGDDFERTTAMMETDGMQRADIYSLGITIYDIVRIFPFFLFFFIIQNDDAKMAEPIKSLTENFNLSTPEREIV